MDYPQDFPAESRAKVEAARIRAGRQFDSMRAKAKWNGEIEALFWIYVLTPFVVFARESSRLGLWPVDRMDEKCREFLRRLTIDAYYHKGKAAGLQDMIDNFSSDILWQAQQEIEKTSLWRKYETIRLKSAAKATTTKQSTGIIPGQFAGLTAEEREKLKVNQNLIAVPANPYFPDLWSQTNANQAEGSIVQNSEKTTPTVESKSTDRKALVKAYIEEVRAKKSKRITRKDIWTAAGYQTRTEFERWQRQDPKNPNKAAHDTFTRILCVEKPHLK